MIAQTLLFSEQLGRTATDKYLSVLEQYLNSVPGQTPPPDGAGLWNYFGRAGNSFGGNVLSIQGPGLRNSK